MAQHSKSTVLTQHMHSAFGASTLLPSDGDGVARVLRGHSTPQSPAAHLPCSI